MFYLLENNRIIDSNTLFTKNIPLWEVKDNLLFAKSKNGKLIKPYKYNAIKNQSENVLDLIEEGDLVKLDKTLNQVITILKEDKRTIFEIGDNKWFSFKELNNYLNNNRLAIYKPDDKGNYIKVWEREKENEKTIKKN